MCVLYIAIRCMFKLNRRNVVSLIMGLVLSIGFLWGVLTPPSSFNFIPYAIHQMMRSSSVSENSFITVFDYCFAVVVLILGYILARNAFAAYNVFSDKRKKSLRCNNLSSPATAVGLTSYTSTPSWHAVSVHPAYRGYAACLHQGAAEWTLPFGIVTNKYNWIYCKLLTPTSSR
jgi:hypothetical protein